MKTWKANVWVYQGGQRRAVEVRVQAQNAMDAKSLVEAQYGQGNVVHHPRPA